MDHCLLACGSNNILLILHPASVSGHGATCQLCSVVVIDLIDGRHQNAGLDGSAHPASGHDGGPCTDAAAVSNLKEADERPRSVRGQTPKRTRDLNRICAS